MPARRYHTRYPATEEEAAVFASRYPRHAGLEVRQPQTSALDHVLSTQGLVGAGAEDVSVILGFAMTPYDVRLQLAEDSGNRSYAATGIVYIYGVAGSGKSLLFNLVVSGVSDEAVATFPGADRNFPLSELYDAQHGLIYLANSDLSSDPSVHAGLDVVKKLVLSEAVSVAKKNRHSKRVTNKKFSLLLTANFRMPATPTDRDATDRRLIVIPFHTKINPAHLDATVEGCLQRCAGDVFVHCVRAYHTRMAMYEAGGVASPNWAHHLSSDHTAASNSTNAALADLVHVANGTTMTVKRRAALVRGVCAINLDEAAPCLSRAAVVNAVTSTVSEARVGDNDNPGDGDLIRAIPTDLASKFRLTSDVLNEAFRPYPVERLSVRRNNCRRLRLQVVDDPVAGLKRSLADLAADLDEDDDGRQEGAEGIRPAAFVPGPQPDVFRATVSREKLANLIRRVRISHVDTEGNPVDAPSPVAGRPRRRPSGRGTINAPIDIVDENLDYGNLSPMHSPQLRPCLPLEEVGDLDLLEFAAEGPQVPEVPVEGPQVPEVPDEGPQVPEDHVEGPQVPDEGPQVPEDHVEGPQVPEVPVEGPLVPEVPRVAAPRPVKVNRPSMPPQRTVSTKDRPSPEFPSPNSFPRTVYFGKEPNLQKFLKRPRFEPGISRTGIVEGVYKPFRGPANYIVKYAQLDDGRRLLDSEGIMARMPTCPSCSWTLSPRPFRDFPNWHCVYCHGSPKVNFPDWPVLTGDNDPDCSDTPAIKDQLSLAQKFLRSMELRLAGLRAIQYHWRAVTPGTVPNAARMAAAAVGFYCLMYTLYIYTSILYYTL